MNNTQFKTQDIILAAVLRLSNIKLEHINKVNGKGTFVFTGTDELKEFVEEFDLGNSVVEPVTFNNMVKSLTTAVRRQVE